MDHLFVCGTFCPLLWSPPTPVAEFRVVFVVVAVPGLVSIASNFWPQPQGLALETPELHCDFRLDEGFGRGWVMISIWHTQPSDAKRAVTEGVM